MELRVVSLPPTISRMTLPRYSSSAHVARGRAVGQHRDQVVARRRVDPLVPQPGEVVLALAQFGAALLPRVHRAVAVRVAGGHVRPPGEQPPVVEGKVEQRGQHLRGQLDRHAPHPVEGLADRQAVEDARGAFADGGFQQRQVGRRDDRADSLALLVVARRVHGDEAGEDLVRRTLGQRDAAQVGVRREAGRVAVHRQDVLVARDRPVGAEALADHVVHRVFAAAAARSTSRRCPARTGSPC